MIWCQQNIFRNNILASYMYRLWSTWEESNRGREFCLKSQPRDPGLYQWSCYLWVKELSFVSSFLYKFKLLHLRMAIYLNFNYQQISSVPRGCIFPSVKSNSVAALFNYYSDNWKVKDFYRALWNWCVEHVFLIKLVLSFLTNSSWQNCSALKQGSNQRSLMRDLPTLPLDHGVGWWPMVQRQQRYHARERKPAGFLYGSDLILCRVLFKKWCDRICLKRTCHSDKRAGFDLIAFAAAAVVLSSLSTAESIQGTMSNSKVPSQNHKSETQLPLNELNCKTHHFQSAQ